MTKTPLGISCQPSSILAAKTAMKDTEFYRKPEMTSTKSLALKYFQNFLKRHV